jgi:dipeptidase E
MRQSGLADLLPSLSAVWVGLSAGSIVLRQSAGNRRFLDLSAPGGARGPAGQFHGRGRTVDGRDPESGVCDRRPDRIKMINGTVEVISEGQWKLLSPGA